MLWRSCSPIECETSRCLSQNWTARESESLASAAVDGDDQSVGSTGSHTTKARSGLPENSCITFSAAEDPCRHTGQVGDNSNSTRVSFFAALNSFLSPLGFCAVRLCSGGCPDGVWLPP